jgi:hypothetical protein
MNKQIPDYPNYSATDSGEIIRNDTGRVLVQMPDKDGYMKVSLSHGPVIKRCSVHRLVALAFIGKSNLQVDHINRKKADNRFENLRYLTASQNQRHSWAGGNRTGYAVMSLGQIERGFSVAISILFHARAGISGKQNASFHGVSQPTICDIKFGRSWPAAKAFVERLSSYKRIANISTYSK